MSNIKSVLGKHWHLISFVAGLIIVFWLLYIFRSVLLPFILGIVFAYLFVPVILWTEKHLPAKDKWQQAKRITLIILLFIVILGLTGLLSYLLIRAVINAFIVILPNAPEYISAILFTLREWTESIRQQFPSEMQAQIDQFLVTSSATIGKAVQGLFTTGVSFIPATFSLAFGFAALPIFIFYIMKDSEKLKSSLYSALSPWMAEHTRNIVSIIDKVLGRYIRAQVMLGLVVAYFVFIGLLIMRIPFATALAAFAGITEFIPVLGPWIGGIAAVIITLAVMPDKVIWVALLFLIVQLLENSLLVPRIQGGYLHIHPAVLVVLLVLGAYLAGFWGMLLAAPLTATIIEIYKYIRNSLKKEENQETVKIESPS